MHPAGSLNSLRVDPSAVFRKKSRDQKSDIFRLTNPREQ
jgi:hypothetical protein